MKADIWKVNMNCTFQKQQTVFILFTTEPVIFVLTLLNKSCVCLPKRVLKRQKYASKIEKKVYWVHMAGFW